MEQAFFSHFKKARLHWPYYRAEAAEALSSKRSGRIRGLKKQITAIISNLETARNNAQTVGQVWYIDCYLVWYSGLLSSLAAGK